MNKQLESALRKARLFDGKTKVWCACLRPDEIIALMEDGAKCTSSGYIDYKMAQVKKGSCNPTWFYFKLGRTKPHIADKEFKNGNLKKKFKKV